MLCVTKYAVLWKSNTKCILCIIRKPYCDECRMNYVSGYVATNNTKKICYDSESLFFIHNIYIKSKPLD